VLQARARKEAQPCDAGRGNAWKRAGRAAPAGVGIGI